MLAASPLIWRIPHLPCPCPSPWLSLHLPSLCSHIFRAAPTRGIMLQLRGRGTWSAVAQQRVEFYFSGRASASLCWPASTLPHLRRRPRFLSPGGRPSLGSVSPRIGSSPEARIIYTSLAPSSSRLCGPGSSKSTS